MNAPRCDEYDYLDFLLGSPSVFSALEAGRVQPARERAPAHDSFTRLLNRLEPAPAQLWQESCALVRRDEGVLVVDDSVLDKPDCLAHGSGQLLLLWQAQTGGPWYQPGEHLVDRRRFPCDYRLVDPAQGKAQTKNHHFRDMLAEAYARGFRPRCLCFDSWYSSLDNLKKVRLYQWIFLTQVRCNRKVNLNRQGNRPIQEVAITAEVTIVHLPGFGLVKAFRIEPSYGHTEYWITNDLDMDETRRLAYAEQAWGIEEYHRGLKQSTGIERCSARQSKAQRNHIGLAVRAFLRLEYHRLTTGVSWFHAKYSIIREAVRAYLTKPLYNLPTCPTA